MYPPHNISQKNTWGKMDDSVYIAPIGYSILPHMRGKTVFLRKKRINFFTKSLIAIISVFDLFDLCLRPWSKLEVSFLCKL